MTATVKVKFPDGIREVPAFFQMEDPWARSNQDSYGLSRLTPLPIDGWEFRGVIGGEAEWHACQVQTDAQRRQSERLWREEYQIPYSGRNGYNEDFR